MSFSESLRPFLYWDFLRYLVLPALVFAWVHLLRKSQWHSRLIQKRWSTPSDHLREIRYLIPSVAVFALMGALVVWGAERGLFLLRFEWESGSWLWAPLVCLLMIAGHDAYFYWTHRWMHHPRLFRIFHKVHHLSRNPSPWSAYSFSVPEALVQALYVPLFLLVVPTHFSALLVFLLHMNLRSVLAHMNVEAYPAWLTRSPLCWWTSSTHHNLHHQNFNSNFGIYFTFWDQWMGTEDPAYEKHFLKTHAGSKLEQC